MTSIFATMIACAIALLAVTPGRQETIDPSLKAAVDRFFATQQAEDVDAYLSLWSTSARRPTAEMLKYVFDSGDDVFSEVQITRVQAAGERLRVRVSAVRDRTAPPRPDGRVFAARRTQMVVSLTFVREGEDWKLIREGPAFDDLAHALVESHSADERARLLAADADLLGEQLLAAIGRIAADAAQQSKHEAAQAAYERMLDIARHVDSKRYEGEALQNLGNVFYFRRNFTRALESYEQRLAIERGRADDSGMAAALGGIATVRYARAEYTSALAAYRDALAIQERMGDDALIATSLISIGNVLYLQGDFDGAIRDYSHSRDLNKKIFNLVGEAAALEGLGRVHLAKGDFAGALDAFTGVLQEALARQNRVGQGNALLSIGEAHYRLGNLDVARKTFDESRIHFEAAQNHANVGRAWQAIALTDLVAARFDLAEQEYVKSRTSCRTAGDPGCVAAANAGLAFAQAAQEKYAPAIRNYLEAADQFTSLKAREQLARTYIGLSHALSGDGEQQAAILAAAEARMLGIAIANDDVVWRALLSESRALRSRGDAEAALASARAALNAVDKLIDASLTRPGNPVPRDTSSVFAMLALLQAEGGYPAAAFDAIERMRVHELRLGLAAAEREIAKGMTPEEREEERGVAVELVTLHAQLSRVKQLPKPEPARVEELEKAIGVASEKRVAQQAKLFERLPDLRTWRALIEPATSTEIVSVIGEGDVLLQFVIDEKDLLILAAAKNEGAVAFIGYVQPLTRRSVAEYVAAMTQPAVLQDVVEWRRKSAKFIEEAFPSSLVDRLMTATRVIVVPHEVLWRMPFEALPVKQRFLGDVTSVTYVPSATAMVRVPARQESEGPIKTFAAAAPVLSDTVVKRIAQTAPAWTLRNHENATAELKQAFAKIPQDGLTVLTGADAIEPAIRQGLAAADVLHLALPFRINGAGALFSPLLLAGEPAGSPPEQDQDARLDARDVINMRLTGRLVVLSDPAAMSMRDAADETVLVHWAWLAAGVPSLLMPRWASDPSASELLSTFHERVRAGDPLERALHTAQHAVRRSGSRGAPFHWAGWLLIGAR